MRALITGASSGIGKAFAYLLNEKGYDLILVARRKNLLLKIKEDLKGDIDIYDVDISTTFNCLKLYNNVKDKDIDIVINAAGFGAVGQFSNISLDQEMDMIDLNIKAVHTLTKLFLNDFLRKNKGYILNVASIASFQPGPLMATYYATKSYVYNLTTAINYEIKGTNVYVGCLNPGPVRTNFNKIANVNNDLKSYSTDCVCQYALLKMFKKKTIIIPGLRTKLGYIATKIMPRNLILKYVYRVQKKKIG